METPRPTTHMTGCIARRAAQQLGTAWEKSFSAYCLRCWLKPRAHRLAGAAAAAAKGSFAVQLLQRDLTAESQLYRWLSARLQKLFHPVHPAPAEGLAQPGGPNPTGTLSEADNHGIKIKTVPPAHGARRKHTLRRSVRSYRSKEASAEAAAANNAQPPSARAYARWALFFSLLAALLIAGGAILASQIAVSGLKADNSLISTALLQQLTRGALALAMLLLALAVLWRTEIGIHAAAAMLPFVPFKALFLLALLTLASLFLRLWRNRKRLRTAPDIEASDTEQEYKASSVTGTGASNAANSSANQAGKTADSSTSATWKSREAGFPAPFAGPSPAPFPAPPPVPSPAPSRGLPFALPPTLLPIGLFFAVLFYATVTSVYFWTSASEFLIPVTGLIYLLAILACFDSEEKLENLLVLLALAGFLAAAYAIYYYYTGPSILDMHKEWVDLTRNPDIRNRAYAVFENPNLLAQFCVQLTALALGGLFAARRPASRIMFVLAAAAASFCLLLTYSRGGWIAWAVAIAVFGFFMSPALTLTALPVGGALLYGVAPASIHRRLATAASLQDSSNAFRVDTWNSTLALIKAHWLSGVGLGRLAFVRVYATYMINNNSVPHSHNLYLQLVSEFGILGLAVFLWLMWRLFRLGLKIRAGTSSGAGGAACSTPDRCSDCCSDRRFDRCPGDESALGASPGGTVSRVFARSVTAGAMGALAGLLAHSAIDYFLWYYKLGILLWLVIALVIVFEETPKPVKSLSSPA